MNDTLTEGNDRNNFILFTNTNFQSKLGIGLGIGRFKITIHSIAEALGYSSTSIGWDDAIQSMQSDIGKSLIPSKAKSILSGVATLVVPGGVYASQMFGNKWNWAGAWDFDRFRVYTFTSMMGGVLKYIIHSWIVSEETGGSAKSKELFKAMISHSSLEPISNDEFNGKIDKLRLGIKEMLAGVPLQGLDNNAISMTGNTESNITYEEGRATATIDRTTVETSTRDVYVLFALFITPEFTCAAGTRTPKAIDFSVITGTKATVMPTIAVNSASTMLKVGNTAMFRTPCPFLWNTYSGCPLLRALFPIHRIPLRVPRKLWPVPSFQTPEGHCRTGFLLRLHISCCATVR